ncbi:Nn.00g093780.m01.CDS01 [Neocucurbitaria sp. VM-36]
MSLFRNRDSRKSATILRAVPENTACDTALHPDQRDMTTQAYMGTNEGRLLRLGTRSSPSLPGIEEVRTTTHNSNTPALTSTQYCPVSELKAVFGNTSLKGAIGTYKNGRIHWRQKDRESSESDIKDGPRADRNSRPKIQVVIPNGRRDQPLPATPFFGNPSKTHLQSPVIGINNAHDVSPPSASNNIIMRDSIVSPLGQLQPKPIPFGQFQHSVTHSVSERTSHGAKHYETTSGSSSSSRDSQESDASSIYSSHSSETSIEAETAPLPSKFRNLSLNPFNIQSPITAGVFNADDDDLRHRVPPSLAPPRQYTHHPPSYEDAKFRPTCELEPPRWNSTTLKRTQTLTRKPTLTRKSSKRQNCRRSLASNPSMGVINEAISRSTSRQLSNPLRGPSPTLSEAENDLHEQLTSFTEDSGLEVHADETEQALTSITEDSPFKWDDVVAHKDAINHRSSQGATDQPQEESVTTETGNAVPPAVPRKSSKRQSAAHSNAFRLSQVPRDHIVSQMTRGRSQVRSTGLTLANPEYKRMTEDFVLSPIEILPEVVKRTITPSSAETVILNILRSLDHLEDLFATAVVNRGFHRVFKRHELELVKSTLRKMSPAAWEFREIAFPGHDLLHAEDLEMTRPEEEYTPSTYLQLQKRDVHIIRAIKLQIQEKCQSFVRPEISLALTSENAIESARVDNALWRIWTFCKIFGSGKNREEDIVAQMDWLKGGLLVHQKTCTFSIMSTDYMSDTLVGAPDCFAKGNEGGLTAEQLFDMMELWNCLGVLLQGFEGRTAQARKAGIYDNTDIRGGDIDGEELMLDEWRYHLLTHGLATILDLAGPSREPDCSAFQLAQEKGWVNWKPPVFGGTRRNFLKEAASRVYEDKIAHTYAATSTRDVQRQQSKIRIQKHISELRHRKNSGERIPMIRMSQERPMSDWDTVIGNLTRPRPTPASRTDIVSYIPTLRSALAQELSSSIAELPASRTPPPPPSTRSSSPRRTVAQPLLPTPPPSTVPSTRDRNSIAMSMPSIEEHPNYRNDASIPAVPSLATHPAFRNGAMVCAPLSIPPLPLPPSHHHHHHERQNSGMSMHSQSSGGSSPSNPAFQQHQTQRNIYETESYENTADKAIYRIVEMGFTADQAREALRMTDLGDGLRVDRAVELLLSRQI